MGFDISEFSTPNRHDPFEVVEPLSTGHFLFDYITGIGGLPRGRMVEAFGPESSGKSTAFYQAIAQAQRQGGVGLIEDYENAFVGSYARQLGLDVSPDRLLVESPTTLEEGFELALKVTRAAGAAGVPCVVMFDSLAAMPMEDEVKIDSKTGVAGEQHNMQGAQRAKAITHFLRQAVKPVREAGAIWCFVNHELDVIETGWVSPAQRAATGSKRTPGGRGVKFYCSQRFQFSPAGKLKGRGVDPVTGEVLDDVPVAVKARVTAVKNKLAAPNRSAAILIRYGVGLDRAFSLCDVGIKRGLIERPTKQSYLMPDGAKVTGLEAAVQYLNDHPSLADDLETTLRGLIETAWREEQERMLASAAGVPDETDIEELAE